MTYGLNTVIGEIHKCSVVLNEKKLNVRSAHKKNGPTLIEKNEYLYIVFVSHPFQNPRAKYHFNTYIHT